MTRGVVLVAHNTQTLDYYAMAAHTASRVQQFLKLPVTLITDTATLENTGSQYKFSNVVLTDVQGNNYRGKNAEWHNKGRYRIYELSPYSETLVLDTDYVVNSSQLLATFDYHSDFVCHDQCRYLLDPAPPEHLHRSNHATVWATVMRFRRTPRVAAIFNLVEMIQRNYAHYGVAYKFMSQMYRNDYALTIALHTVNGHVHRPEDYLQWPLLHASLRVRVARIDNTAYKIHCDQQIQDRVLRNYYTIRDTDFHMLDKQNFMQLWTAEAT